MDGVDPFRLIFASAWCDAVVRGGLSCRKAAARFGAGESTAIACVARIRETGSVAPGQMGGHRPKKLIGRCAGLAAGAVPDG